MDHLEVTDSRSAEKVTPASEAASLADRVETAPAYSGDFFGMPIRIHGQPFGSGTFERRVLLIDEQHRNTIVAALRGQS